jgi:hypothetical protein
MYIIGLTESRYDSSENKQKAKDPKLIKHVCVHFRHLSGLHADTLQFMKGTRVTRLRELFPVGLVFTLGVFNYVKKHPKYFREIFLQ